MIDIATLRAEHREIARLLAALEQQVALLPCGRTPDYELVRGIAEYFCDYPALCHHPKEDAVFARLRLKAPKAAAAIGDLAAEHREVGARVAAFRDLVATLYRDAVVPREKLVSAARDFIAAERRHMAMEEERFFPAAEKALAAEDWAAIDTALTDVVDPLFGEPADARFAGLREQLLSWEREARAE